MEVAEEEEAEGRRTPIRDTIPSRSGGDNPGKVKPMGQLPPVFDGDRTKTEGFVDSLKAYFQLNHEVPAF